MSIVSQKKLVKYQKALGKRVKSLRKERDMSQLDLATLCDLEKTSISRIENGRANITLKTAILLSESLNIKTYELFKFEDEIKQ
ncbi:helix-turn-helix domain-containing protein [Tenacibaculum mesophilum]|uniref:helix-turn-helix domain-containing protein n=1 Tax=Tenacibaculum mesophilum TaxID=104268 RepID=UPI002493837D|nr:helix-turn-helix transcriptional regulator [Tenacibaculum mesophilum]